MVPAPKADDLRNVPHIEALPEVEWTDVRVRALEQQAAALRYEPHLGRSVERRLPGRLVFCEQCGDCGRPWVRA